MLIINQLRTVLISLEIIVGIDIEEQMVVAHSNTDTFTLGLGKYETEERTKEVFQEIVQAYKENKRCYYMPEK